MFDGEVGVCVGGEHLLVVNVPVADPAAQALPPVLQHVGLGELRALTVAEPPHRLASRDVMIGLNIHVQNGITGFSINKGSRKKNPFFSGRATKKEREREGR